MAAKKLTPVDLKAIPRDVGRRRVRLISRQELCERIGVTFPTIWQWIVDGKFPQGRTLGGGRTLWLEAEVDAWIEALPRRPYKHGDKVA
jgi:excisionase family DNA binding protein